MTLVSIPANPVPEDVVSGTIRKFRRRRIALRALGAACGAQGHGLRLHRAQRADRKILRDRAGLARSRFCGGDDRLARTGSLTAALLRDPRKGYVRDFSDFEIDVETFVQQVVLPDCPPPYFALAHSMGGAVMLRVAHAGKRWFDRMVLSAPMIDLPGRRTSFAARALLRFMRLTGQGGRYVPGGSDALTGSNPSSTIPSPAIPCALRAMRRSSRRNPPSASARRRWPGPIPPSRRCIFFAGRIIRPKCASRS